MGESHDMVACADDGVTASATWFGLAGGGMYERTAPADSGVAVVELLK